MAKMVLETPGKTPPADSWPKKRPRACMEEVKRSQLASHDGVHLGKCPHIT